MTFTDVVTSFNSIEQLKTSGIYQLLEEKGLTEVYYVGYDDAPGSNGTLVFYHRGCAVKGLTNSHENIEPAVRKYPIMTDPSGHLFSIMHRHPVVI